MSKVGKRMIKAAREVQAWPVGIYRVRKGWEAYVMTSKDLMLLGTYASKRAAVAARAKYWKERADRGWEDWQSLLQAFTLLTEDIVDELKAEEMIDEGVDFRTISTEKGSSFQKRFLPRWESYEALLGANHKPL